MSTGKPEWNSGVPALVGIKIPCGIKSIPEFK